MFRLIIQTSIIQIWGHELFRKWNHSKLNSSIPKYSYDDWINYIGYDPWETLSTLIKTSLATMDRSHFTTWFLPHLRSIHRVGTECRWGVVRGEEGRICQLGKQGIWGHGARRARSVGTRVSPAHATHRKKKAGLTSHLYRVSFFAEWITRRIMTFVSCYSQMHFFDRL